MKKTLLNTSEYCDTILFAGKQAIIAEMEDDLQQALYIYIYET
jgi:hypothetical protein